jgi:tetratricopeptide (TPR) repeat protein
MKERLHDAVEHRGRSSKTLVVCGLGGAGKSQLTLSYIESYRDDYTAVFWIDAGAKIRLEADYKQIRNLLYSSKRTDIDLDTCVAEVKQWCHHKHGRWLFVFDSADDIDDPQSPAYIDLRRVIIDVPSADVIITTRCQSSKDMTDLEAVQVAELTPDEARDLFLRRSKLPSPSGEVCEEVDAIAKELGFFALAISLAAAYVAETPRLRRHPGGYLDEYRRRRKTLLDRKPKTHVDQYGASVLTTWETSYTAIFDRCPEACKLLVFLTFLSPDDLFMALFQADDQMMVDIYSTWLLTATSSKSAQDVLDSSLEVLGSYSLVLWNDEQSSYYMHKLVHAWSFERSDITSKAHFCRTALDFLNCFVRINTEGPYRAARLFSHITVCFARACEVYAESDIDKVAIVDRLKGLAGFLYSSGGANWGYDLFLFVHDHYRRLQCADRDEYYVSVVSLGNALLNRGAGKEAIELLRPALSEYREAHGPNRRSDLGARIAQTLGRALTILGNNIEAVALLRRALDECETVRQTMQTMRALALVLSRMNRNKEAEELSKQAFEGMVKHFGPTARATLHALLDYVEVLKASGQYEKSNLLARQALHGFEVALGPQNMYTMLCMAECGATSLLLGDLKEAENLLRRALRGLEGTMAMDHSFNLYCVSNLALCLRDQGSYDEAAALFRRAFDGYAATLGFDHPFSLYSSSRLATLRSFLQERAALPEVLERVSIRINERLQEGQHLRRPLRGRRRAFTYPGGFTGAISRRDLIHQEESDNSEESESDMVSDSGRDVAMDAIGPVLLEHRRSI